MLFYELLPPKPLIKWRFSVFHPSNLHNHHIRIPETHILKKYNNGGKPSMIILFKLYNCFSVSLAENIYKHIINTQKLSPWKTSGQYTELVVNIFTQNFDFTLKSAVKCVALTVCIRYVTRSIFWSMSGYSPRITKILAVPSAAAVNQATSYPFILLTYSTEQSPSWGANWFCS